MKKRIISLLSVVLLGVTSLWAIPANPFPMEMKQPDGSMITIKMVGDEFGHYDLTEDGIPVMRGEDGFFRYVELTENGAVRAGNVIARNAVERTEVERDYLTKLPEQKMVIRKFDTRRKAAKQEAEANMPSRAVQATGNARGLVLLVQFSDEKFTHTQSDFNNMMNQQGYNYNNTIGSVRDYFIAQSGGKFTPTFDVYGPFTLSNNEAYYGADGSDGTHDPNFLSRFPSAACSAANGSVDFSQYDADGDGYVDLLYIIYAGYAQSSSGNSNDIWPKSGTVSSSSSYDGKKISRYACSAELKGSSGTTRDGIGTFIHEYSHTLGLPDFYDTGSDNVTSYGMSYWDMMCYGGYRGYWGVGYTAYERAFCGWLTLEELPSTGATLVLENLGDSQKAYKMSSSDANQYFILENRQLKGWDAYLPGAGLMITKVDYNASIFNPYGAVGTANTVNVDENRQRMTIMPADNDRTFYGEAGDLYPYNGNNSFTKNSSPASITNTAGTIDRPVTNIIHKDSLIIFDVNGGGPLATPVIKEVSYDGTSIKVVWNFVPGAVSYSVRIYRDNDPTDIVKTVTTGTDATEYWWYQPAEGHTYTVQVKSISDSDFESEFSAGKSITLELEKYAVNFTTAANGTFNILNNGTAITSGTMVEEGTTLTVEATPNDGYKVDVITVNGEEIAGTNFTVQETTTVVVTFTQAEAGYIEYCIPETGVYSYGGGSRMKTLTLSATGSESCTLNLHPSDEHDAYLDFTEEEPFRVDAGATISVTYTYSKASYFNYGFFYVDWNKDGELEQVFKTSNTLDRYNVISFAVPSDAAGAYRARFQVDNSGNTDPCALVSLSTNYKAGSMTADFIVYIGEAPAPESYAVNFGTAENGTFRVLHEGTAITSGTLIEEKTTLTVETTPDEGYQLDVITVNGSEITGNTFEVKGVTTVAVTFKEREAVEYTTPTGAMHSNGKTYVEHIYTENAYKNVDKTWTSAPSNVYQLVDGTVEVERGYEFNLHLDAYSMGASSTTAVRQDLRYTTAVIFSDWDCDGVFTQEQVYGSNPPAHNVTGNMEVMEINKTFTVPADAYFGESRIRVIYSNAWGSVPTADMQTISDGMAYDIVVKVSENLTTAIESVNSENKIYAHQGKIVVKCNGEQRVEVINLMGQTVLSTVVNNNAMFNMPAQGVYIVRCGEQVNKVVVQ